ncbi:MAG: hypothetical protein WAO20_03475 [Acidobacteriota bacterium]
MERVVVFGAGCGGERGLRTLPRRRKAVAFCDNDPAKQGERLRGLPVIPPNDLRKTAYDRILIASMYYPEIYHQLVDLGVTPDRIDILDPDILSGQDDPTRSAYGLLFVLSVILGLAVYGMICLVLG